MTDTLQRDRLRSRKRRKQGSVAGNMTRVPIRVRVIDTRQDVTVEQAAAEIAAYIRDHEGVDSVDLVHALLIPIHIVEEAAERLVAQGKIRHLP